MPAGSTTYDPAFEEQIRGCLNKVLASPGFGSKRRAELLRYLVEETLAGRQDRISEYGIALDVLRRPDSFDPRADSSVRSEMSRLRHALAEYYPGEGAVDPLRFEFPGRGYVPAFVMAGSGEARTKRPTVRRLVWAAVAAAAVAAVGLAAWKLAPHGPALRSVIVLPFVNLTGDPANEYLSDGLTEGLTDALAHIASLRVVARTSAFQFKGKNTDIREVGRRVQADVVIEGSLRKVGDGFRLTVQVNRASDGYHILSRTFDGAPREVARLERDMALPVIEVIRPGAAPPGGHLPKPEAYDLVLKVNALGGRIVDEQTFRKVLGYLNEAIEDDPQYADAYGLLAEAFVVGATNETVDPLYAFPRVKAAAAKALELDPQSAGAYDAEGYADAMIQMDWKHGEEELRTAARLMPQNAAIHDHLGHILMMQGKFEPALRELRMSQDLNPLIPAGGLGYCYFFARRYDEALAEWLKISQLHPDLVLMHEFIGMAWEAKGEYGKARAEYDYLAKYPADQEPRMAHLLAVSGKTDEARSRVAKLDVPDYPDPMDLAAIYAALGDREKAFFRLEQLVSSRHGWMLKVHPFLDPLRGDPRYTELLKKAGLFP